MPRATPDRHREFSGSQGHDSLVGTSGVNTLQGWNGNDVLTGAGGKDTLTGGAGGDRFVYGGVGQSVVGADADRITDFSHAQADKIDLSAIDANSGGAGDQAFSFIGTGLYTGVAGQLRYAAVGGVTTIAGDVDGDGTPTSTSSLQAPSRWSPATSSCSAAISARPARTPLRVVTAGGTRGGGSTTPG